MKIFLLAGFWFFTAVYSCLNYFSTPFAYPLLSSLQFIVMAGIFFLSGRRILELFWQNFPAGNIWLAVAAASSIGLCLFTYCMVCLGFAGLLYTGAVVLTLALLLIFGIKARLRISDPGISWFWLAPAGLIIAAAFFTAWAPIHQYDSLVYHMALPSVYMLKHGLAAAPENMYSHFPQNAEMLFTAGLLLKSDIVPQLFAVFSFALSILWIYSLKDIFTPRSAGLAGLLAVTHTSLFLLSTTSYIENFVSMWITAAVVSFIRWKRSPAYGKDAVLWAVLAGIFAGTGLGTKYYAGICVAGIAVLGIVCAFMEKDGPAKAARIKQMLIFGAVSFLMFLPWMIKNMAETGNPVFPFLYNLFHQSGAGLQQEQARRYFAILTEYGHGGGFLKSLLEFPGLMLQNPFRYGGGMDVLGSLGWELVFASVPLMLLAAYKKQNCRLVALYLFSHCMVWFATGKILRFLSVIVPLAGILGAEGFLSLWDEKNKAVKTVLAAGLAVFIIVRLLLFSYVQHVFDIPRVLLGAESRHEYLSRKLYYYPCARFASEALGEKSKIAFIGEQRTYYAQRESVPTSIFNVNRFVVSANDGADWKDIARYFFSENYTHLLIVPKEMERLKGYGTLDFSGKGLKNWREFMEQGLEAVCAYEECGLYKIR